MNIDWNTLGFEYMDTKCHVKYTYKNGSWDEGQSCEDPHLNMHIGATCLHYGQACFEGLKAFRGQDGQIRIFRPDENAKRMSSSARRTLMAEVPEQLFIDAVVRAVKENSEYIPPYESGGALYIRPLLIGSGARIGIQPSDEYTFIVLVTPVGNYYKGGLKPVDAIIIDGYDRTAPGGTGDVKVAGNYAASLQPAEIAKEKGFPINLYLDSREHKYIDEFGTSNFIAIKDDSYITPNSKSVLPSITNKSLMTIARDMGMEVEQRPVEFTEVESFDAVGACGTAVVLTPVDKIYQGESVTTIGDGTTHPKLLELYNNMIAIQRGTVEDKHDWCVLVND
ncbi:MAG: branched-chain amino acid aminotransferase [Lentisphaeraceae bacterium]|nr:branched-chain amino acid aminotransferase [Lentisphaeraceae bacterium]